MPTRTNAKTANDIIAFFRMKLIGMQLFAGATDIDTPKFSDSLMSTKITKCRSVGLVCPSRHESWLGGLYHLQHLILAARSLPVPERLTFRDIWWNEQAPGKDPFLEVRANIGAPLELRLPSDLYGRLARRVRRIVHGKRSKGLADIFQTAGIDLLFPLLPCDHIGIPFVGWITDFQYKHLSAYYTEELQQAHDDDNIRIARQATLIMLSSSAAESDMRKFFPQLASRARVVRPCSVPTPDWWTLDPRAVAQRLGLPDRFFLISNTICRHKNHRTVFEALRILRDKGLHANIVCTGKKEDYRDPLFFPDLVRSVRDSRLEGQIHFVGSVPRSEHIALLRQCVAVVQPSEFEGWGFSISDAKALGKNILASDIPVHHEHCAPRTTFVPTHDPYVWAEALTRLWLTGNQGPDPLAEEEALLVSELEASRVGRELASLFDEACTLGVNRD